MRFFGKIEKNKYAFKILGKDKFNDQKSIKFYLKRAKLQACKDMSGGNLANFATFGTEWPIICHILYIKCCTLYIIYNNI